jgi:hypothetical protein
MKTAVELFIEQLEAQGESWENVSIGRIQISIKVEDYLKLIEQAKEMEIEQAKQICIRTMETDDIPIGGTMNDYFNDVLNYVINKQQEQ